MVALASSSLIAWRYSLQGAAARLLPLADRVRRCHVDLIPGRPYVKLYLPADGRSPSFGNLFTCGSVWRCPVCAARISEGRRAELTQALRGDFNHVLVTYTLQHRRSDPLEVLLSALLGALRDFKAGAAWQAFSKCVGWVGSVRSLEVTHGTNGWHPHVHELAFFDDDVDVARFIDWLRSRWLHVISGRGFGASWLHGLDARFAKCDIVAYIEKWGHDPKWSSAHEITKHVVKRGRAESVTALGLLVAYLQGNSAAGNLWLEYAAGMFRKHHLQWSRGLRGRLGLEVAPSDSTLAASEDASPFFQIRSDRWSRIVAAGARADILESVRVQA